MSLYEASVPQLQKMLENLDRWLEKAGELAKIKSFDPNVLLASRLAPDQLPLLRQIQSACDNAKFAAARVAGKQAPAHPDTEQTYDEARRRIRTMLTYLGTFTREDFVGAEAKRIPLPFLEGREIMAADYLTEFALPNFYFHVVTAYAILRHNGVDLGKRDYIGSLKLVET